jgi:hypothetical protein
MYRLVILATMVATASVAERQHSRPWGKERGRRR